MIGIVLAFLISVYLITDTIIEYRKLKELKPMEKVLHSQAFNDLDIKIIYRTLDLQIDLNKRMITFHENLGDKERAKEIKKVNKATKETLRKVKAIAKEAGVEIKNGN